MDNFDPYNVLLAIATNIPVLLMTEGHRCICLYEHMISLTVIVSQNKHTVASLTVRCWWVSVTSQATEWTLRASQVQCWRSFSWLCGVCSAGWLRGEQRVWGRRSEPWRENPAGVLHLCSCGASHGREDDRCRFTGELRLNALNMPDTIINKALIMLWGKYQKCSLWRADRTHPIIT